MKVELNTKYGLLTTLSIRQVSGKTKSGNPYWRKMFLCRCDCGVEVEVRDARLLSGRTKSCGCLRKELLSKRKKTHGLSKIREYGIWCAMINRCYNQNSTDYKWYGGRGIGISERWRHSFDNFISDMGYSPSSKHSIDRIHYDGNYEIGNCRWATKTQQARNKSNNIIVEYKGENIKIPDLCERVGVNAVLVRERLRSGWDIEAAVESPVNYSHWHINKKLNS